MDSNWTDDQVRAKLSELLGKLPGGSKSPLARVCGLGGRRALMAIARYGAKLPQTVAQRLEVNIRAIESGELVLVDTGRRCKNPAYPVLVWQWREKR